MRPRLPRPFLLALASLAFVCALSASTEIRIVRVWPEYRAAESFTRIVEFFGGKESAPETIIRTQTEARAGYYFLTRFDSAAEAAGAIIALEYIVPGDDRARLHFLPVDLPRGSHAFLVGVTGSDWPAAEISPTAWRLRVLDASGAELAREQSFLWSLPAQTPTPTGQTAIAN